MTAPARQADGGGSVRASGGSSCSRASRRIALVQAASAGTPAITSRSTASQSVRVDQTPCRPPGSIGGALELFPPGRRREVDAAGSSDLLDRDVGGQRGRPLVDPSGDVEQVAGLPTVLPRAAAHR